MGLIMNVELSNVVILPQLCQQKVFLTLMDGRTDLGKISFIRLDGLKVLKFCKYMPRS